MIPLTFGWVMPQAIAKRVWLAPAYRLTRREHAPDIALAQRLDHLDAMPERIGDLD
jgi:hypothetical protein